MKDQYFGDFGDYQKMSFLKTLRDMGNFTTLVHWMKTKDDGSSDGRHITYLNDPARWGAYDADIFSFLKEKIDSGDKRSLSHIEKSSHMEGIKFIVDYIHNEEERRRISEEILKDESINLVFFDPDNGIEIKSINSKNKHKYVLLSEIAETYKSGRSVLVYQHFGRQNRDVFIGEKSKELEGATSGVVYSIQVKHSVYFFILHEKDTENIQGAIASFSDRWQDLAKVRGF